MSLNATLGKRFSGFELNIDLETDGGILGILGASGSGKSMTLKCLAGIERPDSGKIILNDRVLYDSAAGICLTPQKRRVGYLFQNYALFPNMTVEANIGAGIRETGVEAKKRVKEMMDLLHLQGLEKRYPHQLSGGQQQRAALARILAYRPDVIMLDEPFSALDYYLKERIQFEVKDVLKNYEGDALMVTHSRDEVYRFCENSIILDGGRVIAKGRTRELFANPGRVAVARLTGCKNICPAKYSGDYEVSVKDWGVKLRVSKSAVDAGPTGLGNPLVDDKLHIGIRAHQFERVGVDMEREANVIACRILDVLEQPFEYDILLAAVKGSGQIWWKLDVSKKETICDLHEGSPVYLRIKEADIMLLS